MEFIYHLVKQMTLLRFLVIFFPPETQSGQLINFES